MTPHNPTGPQIETLWAQRESGLIVPNGIQGQSLDHRVQSFLQIKQKAIEVERLYLNALLPLNRSSSLYGLIQSAKLLSDAWLVNQAHDLPEDLAFKVCHAMRISKAILAIGVDPNSRQHLIKLARGDLDLLARAQSSAKNYLWEAEMYLLAEERGISPAIGEPDLVTVINGLRVGIACKKIYSERKLNHALSKAVSQIQMARYPGIVAINIDDLIPANTIAMGASASEISQQLSDFNMEFIRRHEFRLRRYFESSRIAACMVSSSVIGNSEADGSMLSNFSEMACWVIPHAGSERQRIAEGLRRMLDIRQAD